MIIRPIMELSAAMPIGSLYGQSGMQDILQSVNSRLNGGASVMFGEDNPMLNTFRDFKVAVLDKIEEGRQLLKRGLGVITGQVTDVMIPITSEEILQNIPECMYIPILTYEPVRKLFEAGRIQGYGLTPADLPYMERDMWGRLISNGKADIVPGEKPPEYLEYHFNSYDPDYEIEDLTAIDESRQFIDRWLKDEMCKKEPRDLTDLNSLVAP